MLAMPTATAGAAAAGAGTGASLAEGSLNALIEDTARFKLCGGQLVLRIRLASDEVASLKEPAPLFCLASRLAYPPFLFNDVYEHFKLCLPPRMGQSYEISSLMWFDYNNVALRWHYPLGVLCDVLVGREVPNPWDLTVHFRGTSSKELLPFTGLGDLQKTVMSAFRQAVFLQQGSAAPFMKLPKQQQQQLWDSIKGTNLEAYDEVQRQLLCQSLSRCRSLAVRLHLSGPPAEGTGGGGRVHVAVLQPVPPMGEDGRPTTVCSFLRRVVPPLLCPEPVPVDDDAVQLLEGAEVLAHGLCIPLETPLYWLALNGTYMDHFVHLVVRLPAGLLREPGSGRRGDG